MALRFLSPGPHPGEHQSGTAATFDQARSDFEAAWEAFLANRTQADFRAWRDQRDWTARKYEMWTTGEKLPSQKPTDADGPAMKQRSDTGQGSQAAQLHPGRPGLATRD